MRRRRSTRALKAAYETAALFFPFTDLLVADPYAALADRREARVLHRSVRRSSAGRRPTWWSWANDDVFLQIWIGADDKLPRRIRAMYQADPLRLRHEMELANWQLDPVVAPDTFVSAKAQAAGRMAFAAPAPPPRVKPLGKGASPQRPSRPRLPPRRNE